MSCSFLMRFWLVRRRVGGSSIVLIVLTIIITISRTTAPASSSSRRIIATPVGGLTSANCSDSCDGLLGGCGRHSNGANYRSLWGGSTFGNPNFVSLLEHVLVGIFVKFLSCQFITDWLRKLGMPHPEDGFGTVAPVQRSRTWTNKMYYFLCQGRGLTSEAESKGFLEGFFVSWPVQLDYLRLDTFVDGASLLLLEAE